MQTLGLYFNSQLLPEYTALENAMIPSWIAGENDSVAREKAEALLNELGLGQTQSLTFRIIWR